MGQRVIPVAVTAEYIGGDGVTLGAAGSHDSVVIEYDFRAAGPMWEPPEGGALIKYVLWTNPQGNTTNRVNLGVDKLVDGYENVYHASPTADAMCVAGWAEMVVVGAMISDGNEVIKVKTEPSRFRVLPGSSRAADNEGIAATVADQMQAEIEAVDSKLAAEIRKKVNKPVAPYDPDGTEGQVLESLGGGKTRWRDETVATPEAIDEVLSRHPEWVTTVQDNSVSAEKLTADLKVAKNTTSAGFYDEITVEKGVYIDSDGNSTDYYCAVIPAADREGNRIPIYADFDEGTSPLVHAQKDLTSLTVASGLVSGGGRGATIRDGVVLRDADYPQEQIPSLSRYLVYVGIKADGTIAEYPLQTTVEEMLADGVQNASIAYYRLVTGGVVRDVSDIGLPETNLNKNPRMCLFTRGNGDICFFACDGRSDMNSGLTPTELGQLLVGELNAINAWNLDGGGSASLVVRGAKQNRNIDGNGTTDRVKGDTWNVPRKYVYTAVQEAFAQIGAEKQRLIQMLEPEIRAASQKVGTNVDILTAESGFWYMQRAVNTPTSERNGFLVSYVRRNHPSEKKLLWMPYNSQACWENTCDHDVWMGWKQSNIQAYLGIGIRIPDNSDIDEITDPGRYRVSTVTSAGTMTNLPASQPGTLEVSVLIDTYILQTYTTINGNEWVRRIKINAGEEPAYTALAWTCNSAARMIWVYVPANSSKTLSFSAAVNCFLIGSRASSGCFCNYLYNGSPSGQNLIDLGSGTNISCTADGSNRLTISNSDTSNNLSLQVVFIGRDQVIMSVEENGS